MHQYSKPFYIFLNLRAHDWMKPIWDWNWHHSVISTKVSTPGNRAATQYLKEQAEHLSILAKRRGDLETEVWLSTSGHKITDLQQYLPCHIFRSAEEFCCCQNNWMCPWSVFSNHGLYTARNGVFWVAIWSPCSLLSLHVVNDENFLSFLHESFACRSCFMSIDDAMILALVDLTFCARFEVS